MGGEPAIPRPYIDLGDHKMKTRIDELLEELRTALHVEQAKYIELVALNRRLSDAYVRLRTLIGHGAFETPQAPTEEQVWDTTERALKARLGASNAS